MVLALNPSIVIGKVELEPLLKLNQFLTLRQVLQQFHYYLRDVKSVLNASHLIAEELLPVWLKAAIPVIPNKHAVKKLLKIPHCMATVEKYGTPFN